MGRNRRQQRLRERRSQGSEGEAPPASSGRAATGSGTGGSGGGRPRGRGPRPAWRETLDSWGGFTVVGAIAAAVVVAGLLVYLNRPGASANDEEFVLKERTAPMDGTLIGDPNAPVRIIEYADFQCPHCRNFWDTVEPVLTEEYIETGKASFEFRYYPFLGPESFEAAEAAACAADQNLFWDYHDLLFLRQGNENSGVYSDGKLSDYAEELESATSGAFDADAWKDCYDADTHRAAIEQQAQQAATQGVISTPTVFINGQSFSGTRSLFTYREAIDAALGEGAATPAASPAP